MLGQLQPRLTGSSPVTLGESEALSGVELRLWPLRAISGRVTDEADDPLAGCVIRLFEIGHLGGRPRLSLRRSILTNDLGEYRFGLLSEGTYSVAVFAATRDRAFPVSFFPGVQSPAGAQRLGLIDSDIANVNFKVDAMRSFAVSGHLLGLGARAQTLKVRPLRVSLIPSSTIEFAPDLAIATTSATDDGAFDFTTISEGDYQILITDLPSSAALQSGTYTMMPGGPVPPTPSGSSLFGNLRVSVDRDINNISVHLVTGARLRGRLLLEGTAIDVSSASARRIGVLFQPADGRDLGGVPISSLAADGTFFSVELPPGKYAVSLSGLPRGMYLKSIAANGGDVTLRGLQLGSTDLLGLEIDLTTHPSGLEGVVADASGKAVPGASVFVFPADQGAWLDFGPRPILYASTTAGQLGSYRFEHLVPGKYLVIAIQDVHVGSTWMQPEFFNATASRSVSMQLAPGTTMRRNLTVVGRVHISGRP